MHRGKNIARRVVVLALCLSMAACDSSDSEQAHAQYEGTPSDWWSGSYMTLVQDMNGEYAEATTGKRPARIRLY